jgi:hypothetical protein
VANIWEIAIKYSPGGGDMPVYSQNPMRYFQKPGKADSTQKCNPDIHAVYCSKSG